MKTILVLMDTLRRDALSCYNPESTVITPQLDKFAHESCVFDEHWVGSAPCIPARRDIFCGRLNFLERSWGPIEPFDVTLPDLLKKHGVFSHITTDHCHYLRLGGENYLQQFSTWDFHRGQEGDPWVSCIDDPSNMPKDYYGRVRAQYQKNRQAWASEEEMPSPKTFATACEWLHNNHQHDDFFLMVEAFDPHEPFDVPDSYLELYPEADRELDREYFEIPNYARRSDTDVNDQALRYLRTRYKALVSMTDHWFGRLIDTLKELEIFDETLIIVTTDHGYFLGEKDFLGKNIMPMYNELSHLPFFVHFPQGVHAGEHIPYLTQAIDIMPTILEAQGIDCPEDVQGQSFWKLQNLPAEKITKDAPDARRDSVIFGYHAMDVNVTDGRQVYMRAPVTDNKPCYEYAGIPYSIRKVLGSDNPSAIECGRFLARTDYPVYKIPVDGPGIIEIEGDKLRYVRENRLYDLVEDYHQEHNLVSSHSDGSIPTDPRERHMVELLADAMVRYDSPDEQFDRLGMRWAHPDQRKA